VINRRVADSTNTEMAYFRVSKTTETRKNAMKNALVRRGAFYARDLPKTITDYQAFVRARFPAELVDEVLARTRQRRMLKSQ
jgi:hypothetical protein